MRREKNNEIVFEDNKRTEPDMFCDKCRMHEVDDTDFHFDVEKGTVYFCSLCEQLIKEYIFVQPEEVFEE